MNTGSNWPPLASMPDQHPSSYHININETIDEFCRRYYEEHGHLPPGFEENKPKERGPRFTPAKKKRPKKPKTFGRMKKRKRK